MNNYQNETINDSNYLVIFISMFITALFIVVVFFNISVNRLYSINEEKVKKIDNIITVINQRYIELYSMYNPLDVLRYAKENDMEAIKIDKLNVIEFIKDNKEN